jgi:hypothetical protein
VTLPVLHVQVLLKKIAHLAARIIILLHRHLEIVFHVMFLVTLAKPHQPLALLVPVEVFTIQMHA